jgi:NAD(P)-dependent dehydrogenase (short-subunit alcohol dehydrogenase family)
MNQIDFEDRVAIVTGGAQGIGHATAERLRQSGARAAAQRLTRPVTGYCGSV